MAFALEYVKWTIQDWMRVIWTDEAAFYIGGFRGRVWITRNPQEEYSEQCLIPKWQRTSHVMVWGAIIADRLGPLVIWDKSWGNITSKAYVEHITRPVLAPFNDKEKLLCWPHFVFVMQDGAPAHRAKNTQAEETKHGINRLDWPACSPDLNPIETVWRILKKRLQDLPVRPTTIPQMITVLRTVWAELDPQVDTLPHVLSMPSRLQAVIAANGGHTKY